MHQTVPCAGGAVTRFEVPTQAKVTAEITAIK